MKVCAYKSSSIQHTKALFYASFFYAFFPLTPIFTLHHFLTYALSLSIQRPLVSRVLLRCPFISDGNFISYWHLLDLRPFFFFRTATRALKKAFMCFDLQLSTVYCHKLRQTFALYEGLSAVKHRIIIGLLSHCKFSCHVTVRFPSVYIPTWKDTIHCRSWLWLNAKYCQRKFSLSLSLTHTHTDPTTFVLVAKVTFQCLGTLINQVYEKSRISWSI